MKTPGWKILGAGAVLLLGLADAQAQRMPQDSWMPSVTFGGSGGGNGRFDSPGNLDFAADGKVFVADTYNNLIQVFEFDGTFVRQWGNIGTNETRLHYPMGVALAPDGRVVVADYGNDRIVIFEPDGTFVRSWGSEGPADGEFNGPNGVAVGEDGRVVVAEIGNSRIQVFEPDGTFVRKWGSGGSLDGQFNQPYDVAVAPDGRIVVADKMNSRIQMFEADGTFIRKWSLGYLEAVAVAVDGRVIAADTSNNRIRVFEADGTPIQTWDPGYRPNGVALAPDGRLAVLDNSNKRVQTFEKSGYRNAPQQGDVPLPCVLRCAPRPGTPYLDVDYVIRDSDSPTVTVAVAAFENGVNSLSNFVRVSAFVDGTAAAVGSNVAANATNRFTWNVAADWPADYVNFKMNVMASDGRGLLGAGFIALPASESNAALTISASPFTRSDLLPVWFWLLASGDSSVSLSSGKVYGAGGSYAGQLLAQGTNTTDTGRNYLFDRIGVREATTAEVARARMGSVGLTNRWIPRVSVGPGDRPKAVNEYGFDTAATTNWSGTAWWVVQE